MTDHAIQSASNTIRTWIFRRERKLARKLSRAEVSVHVQQLWPDMAASDVRAVVEANAELVGD